MAGPVLSRRFHLRCSVCVSSAPLPCSVCLAARTVCVCVRSVCASVVQPFGGRQKGLAEACLLSYAPALCHAADTVRVFSTVCVIFSPDGMCMVKELESCWKAAVLCWEPQCLGSGRTAKALPRCNCPLNVVFFKTNLWVLTEQVRWPNVNKLDVRWPVKISSRATESSLGPHQRVCCCDLLVLYPVLLPLLCILAS